MNYNKYVSFLYKIVKIFEIVISVLLIIGVIIAIPDIFKYFWEILLSNEMKSYILFQKVLSHILLLVIAVEFLVLMTAHRDTNIVHLILLVITRKMMVYSDNMIDLLVATIAISILFFVRKYLMDVELESPLNGKKDEFFASTEIDKINKKYNFNINYKDFHTLGGYVYSLLERDHLPVEVNQVVSDDSYIYTVLKANNGLIESVSIEKA